ncbi:ribbon-helix-helix protein, CopG family [Caulobacter segnis]|uniref:Uncharacterized protein n=1 Tax=Caulobacter segnis TaxID=88688 RepID=A0A2W5UWT6_9CAUL|nr:ribbon-helix-helix protein, CopG family [Caulobacter segnis]PZR32219.1 MAG: hypothetical protein DI526_17385 [Caulobacter segnis]
MTAAADNMVLRTIYLPLAVDRRLREIAFTRDISKGELIRELIIKGLETLKDQPTLADRVSRASRVVAGAKAATPRAAAKRRPKTSAAANTSTANEEAVALSTRARALEPAE